MSNLGIYKNMFDKVVRELASDGDQRTAGARWFRIGIGETKDQVIDVLSGSLAVYKKLTHENLCFVVIEHDDKRGVCAWSDVADSNGFVNRALRETVRGISGEEDEEKLDELFATFLDEDGRFKGVVNTRNR
jgi:hypothetical protein